MPLLKGSVEKDAVHAEKGAANVEKGAVDVKVEPGAVTLGSAGAADHLIYSPAVQTEIVAGYRLWTGVAKGLEAQPRVQVATDAISTATDVYKQRAATSKAALRCKLERLRVSADIDELKEAKFMREVTESAQRARWLAEREVGDSPTPEDCVFNVVFVTHE